MIADFWGHVPTFQDRTSAFVRPALPDQNVNKVTFIITRNTIFAESRKASSESDLGRGRE